MSLLTSIQRIEYCYPTLSWSTILFFMISWLVFWENIGFCSLSWYDYTLAQNCTKSHKIAQIAQNWPFLIRHPIATFHATKQIRYRTSDIGAKDQQTFIKGDWLWLGFWPNLPQWHCATVGSSIHQSIVLCLVHVFPSSLLHLARGFSKRLFRHQ